MNDRTDRCLHYTICLAVAVFVWGTPAAAGIPLAQASAATSNGSSVIDRRAETAVTLLTRSTNGHIGRFGSPVCVQVTGAEPAAGRVIVSQLKMRIRQLGLQSAKSNCSPNLQIAITTDREGSVRELLRNKRTTLPAAEALSIARQHRVIALQDEDEKREQDPARSKADKGDLNGLERGALIVDAELAKSRTAKQLADYAVMRLLGNTTDAIPDFMSITRLFAGDWSAPAELTAFDTLYLKNLYGSSPGLPTTTFVKVAGAAIAAATATGPARPIPFDDERAERELEQGTTEDAAQTSKSVPTSMPVLDPQPDWRNDVVVTARRDGPALWRIRKGAATIVILGTISPFPATFEWPDRRVRSAISRSKEMLINSEPEPDLIMMKAWTPSAAVKLRQPKGHALTQELEESAARRFASAAAAAGQTGAAYQTFRPAIAALLLNADWRRHSGLSNMRLARALAALGRQDHLRVRYVQQTSLLTTIDEISKLADAGQLACFGRLLEGVEHEQAAADQQARAWAKGDLTALRSVYLTPANCSNVIPTDASKRDRAVSTWTGLLLQALAKEHQTFAMVDMSSLLRPDGVLAQLAAAGAVVDLPPDGPGREKEQ